MSREPSLHELDRLLTELPRRSAPPRFAQRVLTTLDRPPVRPGRRRLLLAAAGAAAALAAVLWLRSAGDRSPPAAEIEALRAEHRQLTAELESLKASLGRAEAPVLYLGGDDELDLVLDLAPLWELEPGAVPSVRPAAVESRPRPGRRADGGFPR